VSNPVNITRGANHLAKGDTIDSLANRAKIQLSAEEWNTIKAAIEHGSAIPTDTTQNVLLGYHYALQKQSRQLKKKEVKYGKGGTQQFKQARHFTQSAATCRI
jgi:hypothetical protein